MDEDNVSLNILCTQCIHECVCGKLDSGINCCKNFKDGKFVIEIPCVIGSDIYFLFKQ